MKQEEKTLLVKSIISNGEQMVLNEATGVEEIVENVTITFKDATLPYIQAGTFEKKEGKSKTYPIDYLIPALKRSNSILASVKDLDVSKAHALIAEGGSITVMLTEYEPGDVIGDVTFEHTAFRASIIGAELNPVAVEYIAANKANQMKSILGF